MSKPIKLSFIASCLVSAGLMLIPFQSEAKSEKTSAKGHEHKKDVTGKHKKQHDDDDERTSKHAKHTKDSKESKQDKHAKLAKQTKAQAKAKAEKEERNAHKTAKLTRQQLLKQRAARDDDDDEPAPRRAKPIAVIKHKAVAEKVSKPKIQHAIAVVPTPPKVKSVIMIESESGRKFEKISYEQANVSVDRPPVAVTPPVIRDQYEPPVSVSTLPDAIGLSASSAVIQDLGTGEVVFSKQADRRVPIASVTKLMTAVLLLESGQPLDEMLTVTKETAVYGRSRLKAGTTLTRGQLLHLMLMSSENNAAQTLASNYPGGLYAFISAMNAKAQLLGMTNTRYADPSGLNSKNASSPNDLAKLVHYAYQFSAIREFSTAPNAYVNVLGKDQFFMNSNLLVREPQPGWQIGLSKTGYISAAGRCLVMYVTVAGRGYAVVLLDSQTKTARVDDALRVKSWLETSPMIARRN